MWSSVLSDYQAQGTQIDINSLPTTTCLFSRNRTLNDGETHWTRNLPDGLTGYLDGDDIDAASYMGHIVSLKVDRNN